MVTRPVFPTETKNVHKINTGTDMVEIGIKLGVEMAQIAMREGKAECFIIKHPTEYKGIRARLRLQRGLSPLGVLFFHVYCDEHVIVAPNEEGAIAFLRSL